MTTRPYLEQEESEAVNLRYYFDLIFRQRVPIVTFLIIIVTVAVLVVLKLPNNYQAVAELLFDNPEAVSAPERELATPNYGQDHIATQLQILKGISVTEEAVKKTNYHEKVGMSMERAAGSALGALSTIQIKGTRIVRVVFQSEDPKIAAEMVNAICEGYIKKNIENPLYFSQEIMKLLPAETQKTLKSQTPMGQLEELSQKELIESLPSVQADPTLRELKKKKTEIENELTALRQQYREQHPSIIQREANLKFIDESIQIETQKIVANLKSSISGRLQISNVRFIKRADPPMSPSGPDRKKLLLIVVLGYLFASSLIVILLDQFDDRIKGQEDIERYLHLPYLGHLPLIRKQDVKSNQERALYSHHKPDSEVAEAIRYIRVGINFSAPPEILRCLLVTSSLPQEGKSFTAANLAVSMALDGNKVLLIDADSRRPVGHRIFQLRNEVGLINFLTSNISFESVIQPSGVNEHLFVMPSGPTSPNPSELFASGRMKELVQLARTQYDRVVIDAPPLTGIGDGFVLGGVVGHLILIVMAGKTSRYAVSAIKHRLVDSNIKIVGVILNSLDVERERYGYYRYHYYTYQRYYGKKK